MRTELREGWYSHEIDSQFDPRLSGIYEWRIAGAGVYVGTAKELHKRIRAYPRNVRNMLDGKNWHGNPDKEYRPIHHELRKAYDEGRRVEVVVLENCDPDHRNARERWWIEKRHEEAQGGGPRVLNVH